MSTCTSIPCLTSIFDPLSVSQLAQVQKATETQLASPTAALGITPSGDTSPSTSAVFGAIAVSASIQVKPGPAL